MRGLESVRVRFLKSLAGYELWRRAEEGRREVEAGAGVVDIRKGLTPREGHFPTHVPLWENDWGDDREHMDLTVREARALGQIDYEPPVEHGSIILGPFVRITPAGMAWLREIDELPQLEPRPEKRTDPNAECAKCGAAACRGVELLHVCRDCLDQEEPTP